MEERVIMIVLSNTDRCHLCSGSDDKDLVCKYAGDLRGWICTNCAPANLDDATPGERPLE